MTIRRRAKAFTLTEILITLAILGLIMVFTLPKLLLIQQNARYNAEAHEFVGMMAAAYQQYTLENGPPTSAMNPTGLTPYLNYVGTTSVSVDDSYGGTTRACNSAICFKLHSGGVVRFSTCAFEGTSTTNGLHMVFDPDGMVTDGTTNGPGKGIVFVLYYTGRITSLATIIKPSHFGCGDYGTTQADPPWFTW